MLSRLTFYPTTICLSSARQFSQSLPRNARFGSGSRATFQQFSKAFEVKKGLPTLRERLLGPTTGKPFVIGTYAIVGASALGISALCYYGLGLSKGASAFDRSIMWPQYVRDRLHSTYAYLAGSLAVTAGSAYAAARTPAILQFMSTPSLMFFFGSLALIIATGTVVRSLDYQQNSALKHAAWLTHCGILGAILAPMCMLGGPILMRAAWYTAGVVGGLSAIAMTAPSEKFLNMAGPLAMGLGVVLVSNIGSFFFPPNTVLGAGLASIVVYGGLILFSAFLLHDTQRVVKAAEGGGFNHGRFYAEQSQAGFDPINAQLSIYMDVLNIFIRIAMILGGGQRRK